MGDRNKNLSGSQRAKLHQERKQMVREAKNYQKQKKAAEIKKQSNSPESTNTKNGSSVYKSGKKNTVKNSSKQARTYNKRQPEAKNTEDKKRINKLPADDYKDDFYVDETKERREKALQRKKAKKKKYKAPLSPRKRKVRRIATYCLIFAVVLIIGLILSLTVLFKTEKINVEGNTLYEEETIVELSGVKLETNIFLAAFGATPQKIIDALPYIENARVDFKIPDTITITVENAEAAYVIISNNQYYKVSAEGRILDVSDENDQELPVILGPELKDTQVGKYVEFTDEKISKILKEINDCIATNNYENIDFIDINDPANISVIYDNRIKIVIGVPEDISYKLKTAMTIITQKLDQNGQIQAQGTLDVSECNNTKKSYFRDETIEVSVALPTEATQPTTQPETTVPETTSDPNYWDDSSYTDDSYDWQPADDGGYSADGGDDSWAYDSYSDDGNIYSDGGDYNSDNNYSENGGYDANYDYSYDGESSAGIYDENSAE